MSTDVAPIFVEVFGRSHPGPVRPLNEDCFLVGDLDAQAWIMAGGVLAGKCDFEQPVRRQVGARGPLWVVCDGMGGAAAGEVASELAAEVFWDEMCRARATTEQTIYARLLRRAVRVANTRLWQRSKQQSHLRGMGTTLSAAGLVGDVLVLAQVGDSRVYLQRGDQLVPVTRDQSMASALVRFGEMSAEEVQMSHHAHTVLQALGVNMDVEVALSVVQLRRDDRLVLCSDGLHGSMDDQVLAEILQEQSNLRTVADTLIEQACALGATDNITALLARFDGDGLAPPQGAEDVPRYTEFDPMEEDGRAMRTTSKVARRLAAQAGLGVQPVPPVVPATGQHWTAKPPPELAHLIDAEDRADAATQAPAAPAPADVAEGRSRAWIVPWALVTLVVVAVAALLFWL